MFWLFQTAHMIHIIQLVETSSAYGFDLAFMVYLLILTSFYFFIERLAQKLCLTLRLKDFIGFLNWFVNSNPYIYIN